MNQIGYLRCYQAVFDFRYTNRAANGLNNEARNTVALPGVVGKRPTYETASRKG